MSWAAVSPYRPSIKSVVDSKTDRQIVNLLQFLIKCLTYFIEVERKLSGDGAVEARF